MVKYLKGKDTEVSDLEGGANIESDCEGDPPEVKKGTPKSTEAKGKKTRAVLIIGSFSAYAL